MSEKTQLKIKLSSFKKSTDAPSILVGFDGFTDEIASCVLMRKNALEYNPIATINDLANRVMKASNIGTNIEIVVRTKKIGGNAPILAQALGSLGFLPYLVGALGYPEIEP